MSNRNSPDPGCLRILIALPNLGGGGAERVSLDLARELIRAGHSVEIVVMAAAGEFLEEARSFLTVHDLALDRMRQLPLALARFLRKSEPDVILAAMWPLTTSAAIARILSGRRSRLVIAEHGMLSIQYRQRGWLHRLALKLSLAFAYRSADAGVGVSQGVAADVARLAWLPVDRLSVVNNAVVPRPPPDPETLKRADEAWGAPKGSRIVSVGSFKPIKNYPLMLGAFALLLKQADATLMLLGKGQEEQALRDLAERLGIAERVIFAGFHADPTPFYQTADVFALSSNSEGLPTVLIEALSHGLPIVATDCPSGPSEILDNGRFGTLVPVGDEAALAKAMADALSKPHDKGMLRARAADFLPEKAAAGYLKLLA